MFCFKCGTELPDDAMFCTKCGTKIGKEEVSAAESNIVKLSVHEEDELESYLEDVWDVSKEILRVDYAISQFEKRRLVFDRLKKNNEEKDKLYFLPEELEQYRSRVAPFKTAYENPSYCDVILGPDGSKMIGGSLWYITGGENLSDEECGEIIKNVKNNCPQLFEMEYSKLFDSDKKYIDIVLEYGTLKSFYKNAPSGATFFPGSQCKKYFAKYGIEYDSWNYSFPLDRIKNLMEYKQENVVSIFKYDMSLSAGKVFLSEQALLLEQHKNECTKEISELQDIKKNLISLLNRMYEKGIIPAKYQHNYVASGMFYEYIATKRCLQLEGHGGVFDTYEKELRLNTIIENQETIISKLDTLIDCMRTVCAQLNVIQQQLASINSTVDSVKRNTQIAAMNSGITSVYVNISKRY